MLFSGSRVEDGEVTSMTRRGLAISVVMVPEAPTAYFAKVFGISEKEMQKQNSDKIAKTIANFLFLETIFIHTPLTKIIIIVVLNKINKKAQLFKQNFVIFSK